MKSTSARPGRTIVLVLLLLVTCYFADWTDDNLSYNIAQISYASGQQARGLGGGSMNGDAMLASFARGGNAAKDSALEAVFGSPLGASQPRTGAANTDFGLSGQSSTSSDSDSDSMLRTSGSRSRAALGSMVDTFGMGSNATGGSIGLGLSGGAGTGLSGGTGFGSSGMGGLGPF